MGRDQKYVCVKPTPKTEPVNMSVQSPQPPDNNSSDEEEEEDEIPTTQDIDGSKPETQREAARQVGFYLIVICKKHRSGLFFLSDGERRGKKTVNTCTCKLISW